MPLSSLLTTDWHSQFSQPVSLDLKVLARDKKEGTSRGQALKRELPRL